MLCGLGSVGEFAGGFNHDFGSQGTPVEFSRILDGENLDALPADDDRIRLSLQLFMEGAQDGVVLKKMRESFGVSEVIGGDKIYVGVVQSSSYYISTNAAKAVNAYFDCHMLLFYPLGGGDARFPRFTHSSMNFSTRSGGMCAETVTRFWA